MNAATLSFYIAVLLVFALLLDGRQRGGYRCPSCNARTARDHLKDCSWAKHYGDDF